ncbi:hypothetical protein PHSY_002435 [Pseudozyma hubeiensis SY62]|uniref:Cyclin-like domain-containing protein n=1 Tax=Pseudozyma hubeiensis (strain SY62) TaxID=1305764 RepID=R9P196_PSEHS|nr:hypothetical protein PHSY_002435 [Pseudozyma hubeiensis SY62]GAC94862.1 hypothetical protein PHSY_002435 [Pseudozyma hubeiensis SY62]
MSASTWQSNRDISAGFIQSVASRLGFPQRTIATAQQIYQRFHLFYPPSDFVLHEISVAALFVAAKLNDTHKKPRDLLLASYALRFPQLVKGGGISSTSDATLATTSTAATDEPNFPTLAGQKRKHAVTATAETSSSPRPLAMAIGSVGEADVDPNIIETDRKRLLALEKLILESLCFNFHSNANVALKMVIKLGRRCGMSKSFIRTAWKVAADMFRTSAPMQYPPNVIAVAAMYAAALLARPPSRTTATAGQERTHEDDAVVVFLSSIKAVSATPAPVSSDSMLPSGSSTVPLSEPFPGCDAECHVHVEDVEEAVHELLDLYLACTAQLPPSLYMSSSTATTGLGSSTSAATPSPLSPADPLDAYAASPSSSSGLSDPSQPASARKKLKQYEYSPPPFALVDWLNSSRCVQLQHQTSASKLDPTAPTKELSSLLTDIKIYLRGIEYDRQKADDSYLAERNILAEANVVPLPGCDPTTPGGVGQLMAAYSVTIDLKPLDLDGGKSSDEVLAGFGGGSERAVVERIRRRKLVAALRLTFVEPRVEKTSDVGMAAVRKRDEQKQEVPKQQKGTGEVDKLQVVSSDAAPAKRNRIEQAKRYLF